MKGIEDGEVDEGSSCRGVDDMLTLGDVLPSLDEIDRRLKAGERP